MGGGIGSSIYGVFSPHALCVALVAWRGGVRAGEVGGMPVTPQSAPPKGMAAVAPPLSHLLVSSISCTVTRVADPGHTVLASATASMLGQGEGEGALNKKERRECERNKKKHCHTSGLAPRPSTTSACVWVLRSVPSPTLSPARGLFSPSRRPPPSFPPHMHTRGAPAGGCTMLGAR